MVVCVCVCVSVSEGGVLKIPNAARGYGNACVSGGVNIIQTLERESESVCVCVCV